MNDNLDANEVDALFVGNRKISQQSFKHEAATPLACELRAATYDSDFARAKNLLDLFFLCIFGFVLCMCVSGQVQQTAPARLEHIKLQLKWIHQFQFAGFYAAIEKGYYREAGLEVEVIEGHPGIDFIKQVVDGKTDYGIEMPDLILRRNAGEPVVALAAIFQHSPIALMSLAESRISSPHDLVGRRVMMRPASEAELRAMIINGGVMPEGMTGLDLAEKLREEKPDLKVIITSGYSTEMVNQAVLSDKRILRLQKPYLLETLSKTIRQCLDQKSEP